MNIKNAGLLTLVAVLVFGMASSPVLQNFGMAYAASHEEMDGTDEAVDDTDEEVKDSDRADDRDEKYDDERDEKYDDRPKFDDRIEYRVENLDRYCELSDSEREEFLALHEGMTDEQKQMHDRYCTMTDEEREEFRKSKQDVMMDFKEKHLKMVDKMKSGHEFVRDFDMRIATLCEMSQEKLQRLMQNNEFLREHHERIAEYCNMSEEEREDFRMTHKDVMDDYIEDFGQMRDRMMESKKDMKMHKMMRQFDVTDERLDEIRDKFKEKHSDLTDEQRDELRQKIKTKYGDYYEQKIKKRHDAMSDLHKDLIIKRHAEMKEFKSELRLKYNDMTEDERAQFQAEFRDKVSDKRFSWISPHKQMQAGISVDQIECREGLNLVLHASSGKAMCLKSSTAERMIEKEMAVPAN